MFFLLSKLLAFLLKPVTWLVAGLSWAVLTRHPKRRRQLLWSVLVLLLLFSNRFLLNEVMRWWEVETIDMRDIRQPYDIGILLGGFSNFSGFDADGRHNFNERANRLLNALELYHRGHIRKLLISGGSGSLLMSEPKEAAATRDFLLRQGVPDSDIIIEDGSRNTRENALLSTRLIRECYPDAGCLLITSAWHMRRARACFARTGLAVTPFSVDMLTQRHQAGPDWWLLPNALGLVYWELLIREWVGCLAYRMNGYI